MDEEILEILRSIDKSLKSLDIKADKNLVVFKQLLDKFDRM